MTENTRAAAALLAAMVLVGSSAAAQPAMLTNAQVRVEPAGGNLARVFDAGVAAATARAWIGYEVPIIEGDRFICDWNGSGSRPMPTSVKLEGPDALYVLYRVDGRAVTRIRMLSEGCAIDAGGLPVTWITDVAAPQSVALLSRFATAETPRRVADGALAALSMHADPSATTTLLDVAKSGGSSHVRGQALFWVAQRAGERAAPAIAEAIERDPDTEVKKKAVFALSQLPKDEGVPRLIEVAEHHSNTAVRRQAMFWLGQSKDPRALAFFERILLK
ncbi:MAG: HEAT repeat domain-containing protein [Acidobacteria bacterium]|nr:HEAT repeat domain-containing protein [Acidobacteriota bacterium]